MAKTGIVHVHTERSHDGDLSLECIARLCRARGWSFALITDHAEDLDAGAMDELIAACARASDGEVLLVPGLEYRCEEGIDILGIGVVAEKPSTDPGAVVRFIRERGGVSIWAHPYRRQLEAAQRYAAVPDITEVWNGRMESLVSPSPERLSVYEHLRARDPGHLAIGGVDLHVEGGLKPLCVDLDADREGVESILDALRGGRFRTRGLFVAFGSRPRFGRHARLLFSLGLGALRTYRAIRSRAGLRP